jgi:dihydroorotase
MAKTFLRQVRYIDPLSGTDQIGDVLMVDGVFAALAPQLPEPEPGTEIIDGTGKVLLPGLIDLFSNSGEPGYESRETLAELMAGAIAGGFTRVGILPSTRPALDNPGAIRSFLDRACDLPMDLQPHLLPWGALTQKAAGEQMTELAELAEARTWGMAGFADGQPLQNPMLVRRLLEYSQSLDCPIALWPCDRALTGNGVLREGLQAQMAGLPGVPVMAETAALTTLIEMVAELRTPIHVIGISTARSVELLDQARNQGLPITASVPWHHLLFSTEDCLGYDPNLRFDPPLGNPADQRALRQGVKDGVIDAIALHHTPYTYEEKTVAFDDAPAGAIGLPIALSALWQQLVASGEWSALELLRPLNLGPAGILRMEPPRIALGAAIEAVLFDPAVDWVVDGDTLPSSARNTPFLHRALQGKVVQVWQGQRTTVLD